MAGSGRVSRRRNYTHRRAVGGVCTPVSPGRNLMCTYLGLYLESDKGGALWLNLILL